MAKRRLLNILQSIIFETNSFIGRQFINKRPPINNEGLNILNLGCGNQIIPGWINADFYKNYLRPRLWKNFYSIIEEPNWRVDLRYPLNCPDNTFDGVFTEHALEHLHPEEVIDLLTELYRILKPGAWIRVVLPDIDKCINLFAGEPIPEEFRQYHSYCDALQDIAYNWNHRSVWNADELSLYLKNAGFRNIKKVAFGTGTDTRIIQDHEVRKWASFYMEAQK